jgi:hypothetical protein
MRVVLQRYEKKLKRIIGCLLLGGFATGGTPGNENACKPLPCAVGQAFALRFFC